ncbi:predicted protein [Sparassis crispa]|uniref:HMG box domain-containing protein n=1 Tax=Sparassis crispa TaxID=139825 RepID=A0A401H326_9APHY|nr:predicted protein [Sparassis crispa]GBE88803.1 predicted protein [Sparassis crispa]
MSAMLANDVVLDEANDDDGMPPLVDNPYPAMTFTFATDMTPITYSTDATSPELPPEAAGAELAVYSPPSSPALGPSRPSHAKKREASYIPRSPNAFILFRSSFIRERHIPEKIEGNHSALSKIIGKCWKALPRKEREVWEAKAIVAQAEHRQRYPDWRFRPAANALAKVKDGPKRRSNKKGRGESEKEQRNREKRCAKIADLLVAGKKGLDLEAAIKEYDCNAGGGVKVKEEANAVVTMEIAAEEKVTKISAGVQSQVRFATEQGPIQDADFCQDSGSLTAPCLTSFDANFKVPLTAMFKRSSSAPASHTRNSSGYFAKGNSTFAERRYSVDSVRPAMMYPPFFDHLTEHEGKPRVGSVVKLAHDSGEAVATDCMSTTQQSLQSFVKSGKTQQVGDTALSWNNAYPLSPISTDCYSPSLPAFEPDLEGASPLQSPLSVALSFVPEGGIPGYLPVCDGSRDQSYQSSYSSLRGWAGDDIPMSPLSLPCMGGPPFVYDAEPASIMKDAFAAASSAIYGDWDNGVDFTLSGRNYQNPFSWDRPIDVKGLGQYAQGPRI